MSLDALRGKKLLILVGGINLVTLVERAKELGIYTIVADYYDTDKSPAKLVADEYVMLMRTAIDRSKTEAENDV